MKALVFITALAAGGFVFYLNGGAEMLGHTQQPELPETLDNPDIILQESAATNPFFEQE